MFVAGILIEKLSELWNEYKYNLKHKQKLLTMDELILYILTEDTNRRESKVARAKEMATKAHLVQVKGYDNKTHDLKPKVNNPMFKKKGTYHVCGKCGHHAPQCLKSVRNDNPPCSEAKSQCGRRR